jgi:hypothetical protein
MVYFTSVETDFGVLLEQNNLVVQSAFAEEVMEQLIQTKINDQG